MQNPTLSDHEQTLLQHALGSNPILQFFAEEAAKKQVPTYIGGGSIRDLLREKNVSDFDIFFESNREVLTEIAKVVEQRSKEKGIPPEVARKLDCTCVDDVASYISKFDFTVNALAWEVNTKALIDPSGSGLHDLRQNELKPVTNILFITSPHSQVRLFRIALTKDFSIADQTLELVKKYSSLLLTANEDLQCIVFAEFLDILRNQTVLPTIKQMIATGTFERLFPEISPFLSQSKEQATEKITHVFEKLDSHFQGEETWSIKQEVLQFKKGSRREKVMLQWNDIALVRLAACVQLGFAALLKLDPEKGHPLAEEARRQAARKSFFVNCASRYKSQPRLAQLILAYAENQIIADLAS